MSFKNRLLTFEEHGNRTRVLPPSFCKEHDDSSDGFSSKVLFMILY